MHTCKHCDKEFGAPVTLRIHEKLHIGKGAESAIDEAIERAVKTVKKVVKRKKA